MGLLPLVVAVGCSGPAGDTDPAAAGGNDHDRVVGAGVSADGDDADVLRDQGGDPFVLAYVTLSTAGNEDRGTELVPPYVQTELMGNAQANDPRAMPLKDFIAETMKILKEQPEATEILVERVLPLRYAEKNGDFEKAFLGFNDAMASAH
jgi:hypothetical protein